MPIPVLNNLSPFKKLHNQLSYYKFFKVFDCSCFPLLRLYNEHKPGLHTQKCVFISYSSIHKGISVLIKLVKFLLPDMQPLMNWNFHILSYFLRKRNLLLLILILPFHLMFISFFLKNLILTTVAIKSHQLQPLVRHCLLHQSLIPHSNLLLHSHTSVLKTFKSFSTNNIYSSNDYRI